MVHKTVPQERIGVYIGIYSLIGGDPRNVIMLAGILFVVAATLSLQITRQVDAEHPVVPEQAM